MVCLLRTAADYPFAYNQGPNLEEMPDNVCLGCEWITCIGAQPRSSRPLFLQGLIYLAQTRRLL